MRAGAREERTLETITDSHICAHNPTPYDPIVLVHARALLTGSVGTTTYVDADLRDTEKVLEEAGRNLDFSEPIAVILLGILQLILDDDEPYAIVEQVLDAVCPGSFLAISDPTSDVDTEAMTGMARRLNERSAHGSDDVAHA